MSKLDGNKKIDRALLKSSQLMNKTFNFGANNPDMDLLVNPKQSDYNQACSHVHGESDLKLKPQSNAKIYFMISALCFDGFFEGLALGVQDSWEKVVFVALAIVINKFAVALSLGVSFKKCSMEIQTFIRLIILFSMFCPLGIVLGYILADSQIARAILLSISAGTFIYVSCSVVIIEEFAITRHKYSKYTCFFMGGVLTTAICIAGIAINN